MKILKVSQITESHILNQDDMEDYFIEVVDLGYNISVEFKYVDSNDQISKRKSLNAKTIYDIRISHKNDELENTINNFELFLEAGQLVLSSVKKLKKKFQSNCQCLIKSNNNKYFNVTIIDDSTAVELNGYSEPFDEWCKSVRNVIEKVVRKSSASNLRIDKLDIKEDPYLKNITIVCKDISTAQCSTLSNEIVKKLSIAPYSFVDMERIESIGGKVTRSKNTITITYND